MVCVGVQAVAVGGELVIEVGHGQVIVGLGGFDVGLVHPLLLHLAELFGGIVLAEGLAGGGVQAEDDVVAELTLHDAAELTRLQGAGGGLEGLDHLTGGENVAVRAALQAGVLAVGLHELVELALQLGGVGDGLELLEQVVGLGLLLGLFGVGEVFPGGHVLGQQEDVLGHQQVVVLGVLGQVLGGGGVLLAVQEHPVDHVAVNEADGAEVLKALVGDAHALEILGIGVLAAQLLLGGGQVFLIGGLVLAGVAVPLFLALGLDHAVHGGVVLGGCFDLVSDGLVAVFVDLGVPEAGLAVVTLHHAGAGVGGVGLLGQPEEVLLGGHVLAVDGEPL